MELGIVGLGKMGGNMSERLIKGGHSLVVMDRAADAVARQTKLGGKAASTPAEMCQMLKGPRAIWLMIPAGAPVDQAIADFVPHLSKGDTLIDGGNTNYKDTIRRGKELAAKGIHYVDVGTSGGIWGITEGYSMMIGGDHAAVERLSPIFKTLAPAPDKGWGRVGPSGAGHFTKMVHNGIEYGMMQAFAEGFAIMAKKKDLELNVQQISQIWQHGSVVRSWLLDLVALGLKNDATLKDIKPWVADSGEGRWTVAEAIDLDVFAPVITLSLQSRFRSRDEYSYTDRMLAMMRNQFGGHAIQKT